MQPKTILTFVVCSLIIALAGSTIFLLATPPQSYILFFLFFLLTATITLTILGKTFTFKIRPRISSTELHVFLIVASIILMALQLTNIYVETINAILYVVVFIFAPGFSLLNIIKFKPGFSRIEFVALAYPLSLASLAIIGTITLILPSNLRGTSALSTITFLSITSLFVTRKGKQTKNNNNHALIVKNNDLTLVIILLLFMYFFIDLYPKIANLPGLDISRNFLQALAFTKDPLGDFYYPNAMYPLFSIYQSSIIHIVKPSVEIFQTIAIFLNIFIILSFYAMATQYLKRYGDHTPTIATLIWASFAGFGWLGFLTQKISNPAASLLSLIEQTNAFSYGDITWRRLFFHLSMEASFTLVFAILYLLKRNDLSDAKQIFLMTLLMMPLPLMHPYGTYLLFFMLLCLAIIGLGELGQHLKHVGYSLTMASFAGLFLNYVLNIKAQTISIDFFTFSEYLLIGVAIITIATLRGKAPRTPDTIINKIQKAKQIGFLITTFLLLLYFASLLMWLSGSLAFDFAGLNRFGYVPWFLYPAKLGLTGILVVLSICIILKGSRHNLRELGALLASAFLIVLVSKFVSTIQMQYSFEFTFNPNSWLSESIRKNILSFREERMFELLKVPLAILASIVLSKNILIKTKLKHTNLTNCLAISGLISLLLISGLSSTLLGFEYYHNQAEASQPSGLELDIINNLRDRIYADGKSIIISPQTPTSYLDLTGAIAIVTESPAAWTSKSPELPLFATRYSRTNPTYIYLHKTRDYQKISNCAGTYLEHIANTAPTYLENQEVQIKTINNRSIPTPHSSSALIIPYDESTMTISKPFSQEASTPFTVLSLFFERSMQSMNFYKEPISYNNVEINGTTIFNGVNSYIRINGTDTNFDKILGEFEFQPLNLTRNQALISKFDWGTSPRKSWEIAQYGKKIAFKISPDGNKEEVLLTGEILTLDKRSTVRCEYDEVSMKIFIDNKIAASKPYQKRIFKSNTDLIIGAELKNNIPTAFANVILRYIRVLNDIPPATEPLFYAYDFLSSVGLNYTTILSKDDTMNNYETLILPYDDIITYEMLTNIETNQQTANTSYVTILNTNGYGPLLHFFGNVSSETFTANEVLTNTSHFTMQPPIEVPIIELNNGIDVKAKYVNNSLSSPLIMTTTRNQLTLIYINVYPLTWQNQLFNQALLQCLSEILSNYINIQKETTVSSWFNEPSLLFTKMKASGTVQAFSNSVALIELQKDNMININSTTSHEILTNITNISIKGYNAIQINSTEIAVQKGYGFYTTLIAYNPSMILNGSQDAYIKAENNKVEGQTLSIEIIGNVTFIIRQPEISVNGEIQFETFYMLHPPTIYTDGRNTTISGSIILHIYVSDETTIALPYRFNSSITVKYKQPLMEFNETASLWLITPYIILIVISIATILIILYFENPHTTPILNHNISANKHQQPHEYL